METRHIDTIRLTNFKRFENLEVRELGQFNLIVGDNNVGKTSLLEALLCEKEVSVTLGRFAELVKQRKFKSKSLFQDLAYFMNVKMRANKEVKTFNIEYITNSIATNISLSIIDIDKKVIFDSFRHPDSAKIINEHFDLFAENYYSQVDYPLILITQGHGFDFANDYSSIQSNRNYKVKLIENLKSLVPDLENIELSVANFENIPFLIVYTKHQDEAIPLAFYGDGTLKLFRILSKITRFAGQRLMIDEIDAGIHYTRYKTFWKVILQAAKENQVQLFMTTHNEECIKYYREAIEELQFEAEARVVALAENPKTKEVFSTTFNFKQFEEVVDAGNDIR
ncbi:MAG: AAA family ATPase [Cyclobacteriaceae bacterium]|nr:AAA family ATPase [Flammeovirgaceae bacterium]MCZ8021688.1 AAA family ATPase [Cytophagales bacterium]MCZ8327222.1 AAA family ATPase [Cyclobacteriaceae bacterium]